MDSINNQFLTDEELGITEIDILKKENRELRFQLNEEKNKNKNKIGLKILIIF
jgi:hypothetical protein